jgi:hypothetical protein
LLPHCHYIVPRIQIGKRTGNGDLSGQYRVINAKALSERIGMNQSLLAQYIKKVLKSPPLFRLSESLTGCNKSAGNCPKSGSCCKLTPICIIEDCFSFGLTSRGLHICSKTSWRNIGYYPKDEEVIVE